MLRWFYVMRTGMRSLLRRRAFDEQLNADIRFHLEEASAEYMRAGLPPDEARRAALRAFGNPVLVVEDVRETSIWTWWERLVQDLRFAFRRLSKQKAFLFTAVSTLGLCIGATAIDVSFPSERKSDEKPHTPHHSAVAQIRIADTGLILAARRAGSQLAASTAVRRTAAVVPSVSGS